MLLRGRTYRIPLDQYEHVPDRNLPSMAIAKARSKRSVPTKCGGHDGRTFCNTRLNRYAVITMQRRNIARKGDKPKFRLRTKLVHVDWDCPSCGRVGRDDELLIPGVRELSRRNRSSAGSLVSAEDG